MGSLTLRDISPMEVIIAQRIAVCLSAMVSSAHFRPFFSLCSETSLITFLMMESLPWSASSDVDGDCIDGDCRETCLSLNAYNDFGNNLNLSSGIADSMIGLRSI